MEYNGHSVDNVYQNNHWKKNLVIVMRNEEMATDFAHKAYDKFPITENWELTGKNAHWMSFDWHYQGRWREAGVQGKDGCEIESPRS